MPVNQPAPTEGAEPESPRSETLIQEPHRICAFNMTASSRFVLDEPSRPSKMEWWYLQSATQFDGVFLSTLPPIPRCRRCASSRGEPPTQV